MPKRNQMDYTRPQHAYKASKKPSFYQRTQRDEILAEKIMMRSEDKYTTYSVKRLKKADRKKIKKLQDDTLFIRYNLGEWKEVPEDRTTEICIIEPSKILQGKFVCQYTKNVSGWSYGTEMKTFVTLLSVKEVVSKIWKLKNSGFKLKEAYKDYKDEKTLLTWQTEEELQELSRLKKIEEAKFTQPLLDWLTN